MMIQTSILTFFLWPTTIDRAISPSFQLSWTNSLASQLFNTSLTYSYHLTRSTAYLSRENFIFSLNKSTNFSQTSRDCYNILSIQTRCYKNPDKPWRFLPTHQNLFQVQLPLWMLFPTHKSFLFSWPTASPLETPFWTGLFRERFTRGAREGRAFRVSLYGQKLQSDFWLVGNNPQHSFKRTRGSYTLLGD